MRALVFILLLLPCSIIAGESEHDVAFERHPGRQLPTRLVLRDSAGSPVPLSQFLGRAPPVLVLGYLECGPLCASVADGTLDALGRAGLRADVDYVPLFVSVDARDEAAPRPRDGWHVLVGARAANELARNVGFRFFRDAESGAIEHPAGFILLTPEGRIARYFTGSHFDPAAVASAVRAAAQGQTPGLIERVLLVFFEEPIVGRYSGAILWLLQVALAFFAGYLLFSLGRR